jgi:hypothetical protein
VTRGDDGDDGDELMLKMLSMPMPTAGLFDFGFDALPQSHVFDYKTRHFIVRFKLSVLFRYFNQ